MNGAWLPTRPVRPRSMAFRLFVIRNPVGISAVVVGMLDVSVSASYFFGIEIVWWYALTLILKLGTVALLRVPGRSTVLSNLSALSALAILLIVSSWMGNAAATVWMAALGFMAHLSLTLMALRADAVTVYLKAVAYSGMAVAVAYDLAAISGAIEVVYGRYRFFGGSHPNLGSEIIAMTTVAAGMSLGLRRFALVALPGVLAVSLMQGRAALLVILLAILVRLYQGAAVTRRLLVTGISIVGLLVLVVLLVEPVHDWLGAALNTAFLIDDTNRGLGTGFVGRSERWRMAWNAFVDKPLLGQGFGYYETTGVESAHNFFMYAFVEFGLLALPIFIYLLRGLTRMARLDKEQFIRFAPIIVLAVFNDRLFNLNPYPFVAIVLLVTVTGSNAVARLPQGCSTKVKTLPNIFPW